MTPTSTPDIVRFTQCGDMLVRHYHSANDQVSMQLIPVSHTNDIVDPRKTLGATDHTLQMQLIRWAMDFYTDVAPIIHDGEFTRFGPYP